MSHRLRTAVRLVMTAFCSALAACGPVSPIPTGVPPSMLSAPLPTASVEIATGTLDPDSPYRTTPEQYAIALKACLQEKGFDVDVDPYDWHLTFQVGPQQGAELPIELAECRNRIDPLRDPARAPPSQSPDQLKALYAYYVAELACLRAAGYQGVEAPPEQVFVDQGGTSWEPRGDGHENIPLSVVHTCEQIPGRPNFLDW